MNNLKRRRESVASVYRKTTKFLSTNTSNLLKKSPNTKKYCLLARIVEEYQKQNENKRITETDDESDDDNDLGERDLDYYLGVKNKVTYWRDPTGNEQIKKDYLLFHCGVSEEEYNKLYKTTILPKPSLTLQPRLKQMPFKIHKKKERKNISFKEGVAESWAEKKGIFRLFANRRDSETSESYSECESSEDIKDPGDIDGDERDDYVFWNIAEQLNALDIKGPNSIEALKKILVILFFTFIIQYTLLVTLYI